MARLPWVKYWYADWTGDMAVQQCSLEARGAWHETLCFFWHEGLFEWTGTTQEWARLWRCVTTTGRDAIAELHDRKVADLTMHDDGTVTIRSRRLFREHNKREKARLRKAKERGHSNVTEGELSSVTPNVTPRGPEAQKPRGSEADKPRSQSPPNPPGVEAHSVPEELSGLELYEADSRLCTNLNSLLPTWEQAYPGVDVKAEIRKAHAWEMANPTKRKTPRGRSRFLNSWMARQQDRPKQKGGGFDEAWLNLPSEVPDAKQA